MITPSPQGSGASSTATRAETSSATTSPMVAPRICDAGAWSSVRSSHRNGSTDNSGAASESEVAPATPAASSDAMATARFCVRNPDEFVTTKVPYRMPSTKPAAAPTIRESVRARRMRAGSCSCIVPIEPQAFARRGNAEATRLRQQAHGLNQGGDPSAVKPRAGRLPEPRVEPGHPSHLPAQADLADGRPPLGERAVAGGSGDGERGCEVDPWVGEPHATRRVEEDVALAEPDTRTLFEHR